MPTSDQIVAILGALGVIGTIATSIGALIKSLSESSAIKIKAELEKSTALSKLQSDTTSQLIIYLRDEVVSLKERLDKATQEIEALRDVLEKSEQSGLEIKRMFILLMGSIKKGIDSRNTLLNNKKEICEPCIKADNEALSLLEDISKKLGISDK